MRLGSGVPCHVTLKVSLVFYNHVALLALNSILMNCPIMSVKSHQVCKSFSTPVSGPQAAGVLWSKVSMNKKMIHQAKPASLCLVSTHKTAELLGSLVPDLSSS